MIVTPEGTELIFDLRDNYPTDAIVIKEIFEENVYEVDPSRFVYTGTVIDIGANIGAFSLYSAQYANKVYAIEPEPNNLHALKNNIELSKLNNIVVIPFGISDRNDTAVINDMGGGSTIKDDGVFGTEIKLITLDALFSNYNIGDVDVLKIDVEGSEVEIILGASKETLNKCKYIAMEFDIRTGNQMGAMVQKLSETHHVRTMGSWERGGMIWAWLY